MKVKYITFAVAALCTTASLQAEKHVAGAIRGRLLESEPEVFVTSDRKVETTFYDAALNPSIHARRLSA